VPRGKLLLDRTLAGQQPVHGPIQLVLVGVGYREFLGERGRVPPAGSGELGVRRQHPRGHHRTNEIALTARPSANEPRKAEPLHGYTKGYDMTVRPRGNRLE
jgi:hypothetical protein